MVLSASNAFQVASEETESSQIALLSWVFPVILQEIPTGPPAIPINSAKKKHHRAVCQQKPSETTIIREAAPCRWDAC